MGPIGSLDQQGVDAIVGRALAAGVNFIDTADVYSFGESERLLGQSLRNLGVKRAGRGDRHQGPWRDGPRPQRPRRLARPHHGRGRGQPRSGCRLDHIDLYQIHGTDPVTPIDETLRALDDLVASGLVRYVGVSNWAAWQIAKALGITERKGYARFETLQAYYSIAGRDLEREIVPMLNEEKLGLMVWSPLAGGLLSGKYGPGAPGNGEGRRATFDFPPVNKDRAWAARRRHARDRQDARCQRRPVALA